MKDFSFIKRIRDSIKNNYTIIVLYLLLAACSVILVNSAMVSMMYDHTDQFNTFTSADMFKHMGFLIAGLATIIILPVLLRSYMWFRFISIIYILISSAAIIWLQIAGPSINGAKRWFRIFGFSIQPSEFFKLAIILAGAFVGQEIYSIRKRIQKEDSELKRQILNKRVNKYFAWFWVVSMLLIGVISMSSLSTGVIFIVFLLFFTFLLKPKFKFFLKWITGGIVLVVLAFLIGKWANVLPERFNTWSSRFEVVAGNQKDPFSINDKNRQQQFAKIALANGKWFGVGLNKSKMKSSLSMAYSDYIMSIAYEEWGIFSIIVIILIFVFWMIFARNIAYDTDDFYFKYIAYGIGMFYPIQVIVNFIVASGFFSTGQPLPIIGYGGSSILGASLSLSVLMIIHNISLKGRLKDDKESNN